MTDIRRCPWCGSQALTYSYDNLRDKCLDWYVQCYTSSCRGRGPIRETEDDAITAWNTRQLFGEGEDSRLVTKLDDAIGGSLPSTDAAPPAGSTPPQSLERA